MDIDRLTTDQQYLSHTGQNIPLEDFMKLKLALLSHRERHSPDRVEFWGRIKGFSNDYYIMVSTYEKRNLAFPERKFFWSNDSFKFAPLPEPSADDKQTLSTMNGYFTGEHDKILKESASATSDPLDLEDDDQIIARGNSSSRLTELDRLGYVVRQIDETCALVPYPSQVSAITGELSRNIGFKGLSVEELSNLQNYRHYRESDETKRLQIYGRQSLLPVESDKKAINTLECLKDDIPAQAWSLTLDPSKHVSYLRSFVWPGFVAYTRANTDVYGFVYMGEGRNNPDLAFTS